MVKGKADGVQAQHSTYNQDISEILTRDEHLEHTERSSHDPKATRTRYQKEMQSVLNEEGVEVGITGRGVTQMAAGAVDGAMRLGTTVS